MRKTIENNVSSMTVVEMRKVASKYGIKNASRYKRVDLEKMLVDAMVVEQQANKRKTAGKRIKANKVENNNVEILAKELLAGIKTIDSDQLMRTNRKVLIVVMKMLHCSRWYRTYDKATMVAKIEDAIA